MKLKTLKDIQNLQGFHNLKTINKELGQAMKNRVVNNVTEMAIFPSELKQEAIKHIKEPHLQEYFLSGRIDLSPEVREILGDGIKVWIKHFFNITEEDLK